MSKIKFNIIKVESFFRNFVCNFVIITLLSFFILCGLGNKKDNIITVSNSEYNGTIYAGDKTKNYVSIMINVYWGNEYLEQMLDILKNSNIKTTFFVGGSWADTTPLLLKRIFDEGHEIGNHGYNHKEHGKISKEKNFEEIKKCHDKVKEIVGVSMNLFAPPGGSYNKNTINSATSLGYKTIMWTRDTIDWRDHNSDLIYSRAISNMSGGDLILMHPTKESVVALKQIIEYVTNNNLKIMPVSDVIS